MSIWKTLLLVYDRIDVTLPGREHGRRRFAHTMTEREMRDGMESFRHFPGLVETLTDQAAGVECEVLRAARPLTSLTLIRDGDFWPSPEDTRAEFGPVLAGRTYHSILVYWPQRNLQAGNSVPSYGWGYGMGASAWSLHATYATVANAPTSAWEIPLPGEVFLHEWLHGVCAHFARLGHPMPSGDADGADRHGYVRSPETGWTGYYRDLMNARVLEDGEPTGIPAAAWEVPLRG